MGCQQWQQQRHQNTSVPVTGGIDATSANDQTPLGSWARRQTLASRLDQNPLSQIHRCFARKYMKRLPSTSTIILSLRAVHSVSGGETMTRNTVFWLITLTISMPASALAQGSSITYQGKLADSGTPASGQYDFQFKLFD